MFSPHPAHRYPYPPEDRKGVIIYSGGMDSFTLLTTLLHLGVDLVVLSFNYGQRHCKELVYAAAVCKMFGLKHHIVNMAETVGPLLFGSALTSGDIAVPKGHYAEPSMKQTVVPNRNMIMLSIAIGYAVSLGRENVYYGAHAGDHDIYPDCRPEFVEAMCRVAAIANYEPVAIHVPYLLGSKQTILHDGFQLSNDYGWAWTCYEGGERPCGKCGACVERAEAFMLLGAKDPAIEEADKFLELYNGWVAQGLGA